MSHRSPSPGISALLLAALFGLCACGGSSAPAEDMQMDETMQPEPTAAEIAQAMIENCLRSSADEFLELQELFQTLLAGGSTGTNPVTFGVPSISPAAITLPFSADLDGDSTVETTGGVGFLSPSLALLTLAGQLALGTIDAQGFFEALPDGTTMNVTFDTALAFTTTGDLDITFTSGPTGSVPSSSSGTITTFQPDCSVTYIWTDIPLALLAVGPGTYPTATVQYTMQTASQSGDGTVAFDGTNVATIDMTLRPSGESESFTLDLETGAIARVP